MQLVKVNNKHLVLDLDKIVCDIKFSINNGIY